MTHVHNVYGSACTEDCENFAPLYFEGLNLTGCIIKGVGVGGNDPPIPPPPTA